MTLKEKTNHLIALRDKINQMKKEIEPLATERDELQSNIIASMVKQGFNSVKTDIATISKSIRRTLVIENEDALVAYLKGKGLTDLVKERINTTLWRGFASEAVKENLTPNGTLVNETEFISIRKVAVKTNDKN